MSRILNKRIKQAAILAAAAVALPALSALAQGSPATFESLDANKDGRISATEARKDKTVSSRFASADKDQDGYLNRAEFEALRAGK